MNTFDLRLLAEIANSLPVDSMLSIGLEWHKDRPPTIVYRCAAAKLDGTGALIAEHRLSGCERTSKGQSHDADRNALVLVRDQIVLNLR